MSTANALIGYSGFVGGNLDRQATFGERYNSKNIDAIAGRCFELVVSAGAPAAKWVANQNPAEDRAAIQRLCSALGQIETRRFILISSVDVYPEPVGVDEDSQIDATRLAPYGRHRLELERFARQRFPNAVIVRLPGLFGPGIKKNVVYDFLHDNRLDLVHQDGIFQFYDLAHIWKDIEIAERAGLSTVNFATEPVSVVELAERVFGMRFTNHLAAAGPHYDFHTKHAAVWGKRGPYLCSKREVLDRLCAFVAGVREGAG